MTVLYVIIYNLYSINSICSDYECNLITGDQYLRPYVISKPEVTVTKRSSKDEFLILASDGLWGVISSEVACQVVRKCLNGQIRRVCNGFGDQSRAAEAASLLAEIALAKGGRDNTSVIVVDLRGTVTSS